MIGAESNVLKLLIDYAPAAIAIFDCNMRYIAASRRYLSDYRIALADVTGRSHYEVFPEIPERWKAIHRRCLAGAIEKAEADLFPRADGTLDWVQWEIHPWYEQSGAIGGIVLFSEVISERRFLEATRRQDLIEPTSVAEELLEKQRDLEALIENTDGSIWAIDGAYRLLIGNALYHRNTGAVLGRQPVKGECVLAPSYPAASLAEWKGHYDRALAGERFSIEVPTRFARPPGVVEYRFSPIKAADGAITGVTIFGRDVSEQKRAEVVALERERKLNELLEILPVGVSVLDINRNVVFANHALEQILGFQAEELAGQAYTQRLYLASDGTPMPADGFASVQAARSRQPVHNVETGIVKEDGEVVWASVSAVPVDFSDWQTVITTADITEHKRSEELVYAQRVLARAISSAVASDEAWPLCLAIAQRISGLDSGGIYLFDADSRMLELVHHTGLGEEFVRATARYPLEAPNVQLILAGRTIAYSATETNQRDLYRQEGVRSVVAVPIRHQARTIGCLNLASHTQARIPTHAQQALETIAAEIGNFAVYLRTASSLRESEEKYRSLVEASDAAIVMVDDDGRILYANAKAAEETELPIGEVIGKTLHELLPETIAAAYLAQVREVIATNVGVVRETTRGTEWYRSSIQPVRDASGKATMALMNATGITELKHAQQELLELNRTLEARIRERTAEVQDLYDNAPAGYHSLDENGIVLRVNQTERNWLGYANDEMIGHSIAEFFTPESCVVFQSTFPDFKQRGWMRDVELEMVRKDGSILPILVSATASYDDAGHFVMSRSTIYDNTERKKAEDALRESEEQNRLLFEESPDAIALVDAAGRVVRANRAFAVLTAHPLQGIAGQTAGALGLLTPEVVAFLRTHVQQAVDTHVNIGTVEHPLRCADGAVRSVESHIFMLKIRGVDHVLVTSRDISTRKQAEEALRLANAEMERAMRLKDEFLANMSHELRTPLNGVLTLSEILLEDIHGPLNDRQRRSVSQIDLSGRHLLALINDLLDLSKIEAGKLELELTPAVVDEVCQASLVFVKQLAHKKNIQLSYANNDPGLRVQADARRLKQMLVNLLSNAVKFTPEGGWVQLQVRVDAAKQIIEFAVQDSGPGIPAVDVPRLFQPFSQLDSALSRQFEGTGLGLALVKRLATQHGGSVRVDSTGVSGQGSCFTITLPAVSVEVKGRPADDDARQGRALSPAVPLAQGPLILVAEDNEVNLEAVSIYLEYLGYRLIVARTGLEVLERVGDEPPDLILMDIQLPQIDGLEVTRRLRTQQRFAATPIVATTALAMAGDRERCLEAGATEYVSKPMRMLELAALLRQLLNPSGKTFSPDTTFR